jgi:predicted nucleotidyltransferase
MRSWVESLHRFLEHREIEERKRRATISTQLKRAAEQLVEQFPTVTRVAVIGSFLNPRLFRTDSDVDVVVSGLPQEDYFAALFLLEQVLQIPVDLIREEEVPENLQPRLQDAFVLYANKRIRNHSDTQK